MARPVGVSVSIASVEGTEFHASVFQIVQHGYRIAQAAAQSVELSYYERVAVVELLRTAQFEEAW
jgi:hypothetical protein